MSERITLTDPKPLPRDRRCPGCGAGRNKRVAASGFGRVQTLICGVCGHEDGEDDGEA